MAGVIIYYRKLIRQFSRLGCDHRQEAEGGWLGRVTDACAKDNKLRGLLALNGLSRVNQED